jgi:hypothetical protein
LFTRDFTYAPNCSKTRQDDDPIIFGPQQPAAVHEDDSANEVRDRNEKIGGFEFLRLGAETFYAFG